MRALYSQTSCAKRRGSSLLLVIATIGVLLAFWGIAYRMTASLIRVESSRQTRGMQGVQWVDAMTALDRALTRVEKYNPPPESSQLLGRRLSRS